MKMEEVKIAEILWPKFKLVVLCVKINHNIFKLIYKKYFNLVYCNPEVKVPQSTKNFELGHKISANRNPARSLHKKVQFQENEQV